MPFLGWRVVWAAFVLAVFGWGVGFYGPPVYLHAVIERTGWALPLVSTAVTVHFLIGAVVVANLPALHRRFGLPTITMAGAAALGAGVLGWAIAREPWQLFAAALLSGTGWVALGAAAVNAIVAPWFVRFRPAALATAYNGASIGGVIFSPLWVALIDSIGFARAAGAIGGVMVLTIGALSRRVFALTPERAGLLPDGDVVGVAATRVIAVRSRAVPGSALWRDRMFLTLATGMALGLFAQIGLLAHLFSVLAPALGGQAAGLAMGMATGCAIAGRTIVGWLMPIGADRRLVACASLGDPRALGGPQRAAASPRRRPVRGRHRQRDVAATDDRAGRVRPGRRAAGRLPDRRARAGHLCLRPRPVRYREIGRAGGVRSVAGQRHRGVRGGGDRPAGCHRVLPRRPPLGRRRSHWPADAHRGGRTPPLVAPGR
jgi:MFS family permease